PALTKNPGHVARFESTDATARAQCILLRADAGGGCTGGNPRSSGRSRTLNQDATPRAIDSAASPRNTSRHDVCVASQASGAPAITAPRLPANIVTPFNVANRFAGNHTALTLRIAMNATETPTPTRVRPTAAISHEGASAKAMEPSPATSEPAARIDRGPSVSASTPTGTCSTMYT